MSPRRLSAPSGRRRRRPAPTITVVERDASAACEDTAATTNTNNNNNNNAANAATAAIEAQNPGSTAPPSKGGPVRPDLRHQEKLRQVPLPDGMTPVPARKKSGEDSGETTTTKNKMENKMESKKMESKKMEEKKEKRSPRGVVNGEDSDHDSTFDFDPPNDNDGRPRRLFGGNTYSDEDSGSADARSIEEGSESESDASSLSDGEKEEEEDDSGSAGRSTCSCSDESDSDSDEDSVESYLGGADLIDRSIGRGLLRMMQDPLLEDEDEDEDLTALTYDDDTYGDYTSTYGDDSTLDSRITMDASLDTEADTLTCHTGSTRNTCSRANSAAGGAKSLRKLLARLATNSYELTELDLDCSALSREVTREVSELLPQNTQIRRLRLSMSNCDQARQMQNWIHVTAGMETNSSIRDVQLRNTRLNREAAAHLGAALSRNGASSSALSKLMLRSCTFAEESALPVLFLGLQRAANLRELRVLQCDLSEPYNSDVIAASIPLMRLTALTLIDANLGEGGLQFVLDNIERTPSLTDLNLSVNQAVGHSPDFLQGLAQMMCRTRPPIPLVSLSLTSCSIDAPALKELAEGLESCTSLRTLDLSGNRFGDRGASYLKRLLEKNEHIKELHVEGCDVGRKRRQELDEGLRYNNSLLKSLFSRDTSATIFGTLDSVSELASDLRDTVVA